MKVATNANEYNNVQRQEEDVVDWEENQKAAQVKVMGPGIAIVIPVLKVWLNVVITSELNLIGIRDACSTADYQRLP